MNRRNLNDGISLITLIITILVIIILAAIVIYQGLSVPDKAKFAKYVQEFSSFHDAVTQEYFKKKQDFALANKTRTDAQIYYLIATGSDISDFNQEPTGSAVNKITTLFSAAGMVYPEELQEENCYQITVSKIGQMDAHKKIYGPNEVYYITDKGEVFFLPGYRIEEGNEARWYINENKYYISDEGIASSSVDEERTGLYINDTKVSNYSASDIINAIRARLLAIANNQTVGNSEVAINDVSVSVDPISEVCCDLDMIFTGNLRIRSTLCIEEDTETGDKSIVADHFNWDWNDTRLGDEVIFTYDEVEVDFISQLRQMLETLEEETVINIVSNS